MFIFISPARAIGTFVNTTRKEINMKVEEMDHYQRLVRNRLMNGDPIKKSAL